MLNGSTVQISFVMPCLNEKETVGFCVEKAKKFLKENNLSGEVIVADNGSTDGSADIAREKGAMVVKALEKGYGNAYHAGIFKARGQYIIIGDSDDTYDFLESKILLSPLMSGFDFVIGNRFKNGLKKESMPWLHRYVGNPLLSGLLRILFKVKIKDAHCGMRAFSRRAYDKLKLQTGGMEYASEMVIRAAEEGLRIKEVPISYRERKGESKLKSFSDGWRHLRFMLLYSPNYLFLIPAAFFGFLGVIITALLFNGPIYLRGRMFDLHPLFLGVFLVILSFLFLNLGLFTKVYASMIGFSKRDKVSAWILKNFTLEKGLFLGGVVLTCGLVISGLVLYEWRLNNFGHLFEIRRSLISLLFLLLGTQIIFSSFFLSLLTIGLKKR